MFEVIAELFSYAFMTRALVVGLMVALCAALLGVSLVLKRYAMIGDGLSHVGFGSLAVATALGAAPLAVALPVVGLAAVLLLRLSAHARIKGDAAIALISATSLALGVLVISLNSGLNTEVNNYLFGSILAMSQNDVLVSLVVAAVVLLLFCFFYHKIFAVTFDEDFAQATGVPSGLYKLLLALLTALVIVLGMRIMGALLISSLLIFPALTSLCLFKSFRSVTISAAVVALCCFFVGMSLSFYADLPAGATVVLVNGAVFVAFWLIQVLRGFMGRQKSGSQRDHPMKPPKGTTQ